ncbi:hypothetical protein Tco_0799145 [Tanacetum coccineum]
MGGARGGAYAIDGGLWCSNEYGTSVPNSSSEAGIESHHTPTSAPSTSQPPISPTSRRTIRHESVVPQPISPTQAHVADEAASTGVNVRYGEAATTVTGLEAGQGSGNIDKTPTMPPNSPLLRVNTLGCDEGSLTLQELTVLCTTLSKKVESLETDLKQTKLTYGAAYTKLNKKVKKLENKVKSNQARKRAKIVVSDDEEDLEDPFKQGRKISEIDQDPTISLVQHDAKIQGRQEHDMEFKFDLDAAKDVSTAEEDISTAKPVSTAGAAVTTASVDVSTATISTAKDKGKGIMEESEPVQTKTKLQQEQERLGYEAALRLQDELEEEERQRIASYKQRKERSTLKLKKQDCLQSLSIRENGAYTLQQLRSYSFDEIKNLFETTMRRVHTFVPMDSEIERAIPESTVGSSKRDAEEELAQESSKRQKTRESSISAEEPKDKEEELSQERLQQMMIIVPEQGMNVEALQTKYPIIDWEIYTEGTRGKKGIDIYMLVEKGYPLSRGTFTLMLVAKLLVDQDNEMSRELLGKIFMQAERPRR